MSRIVLKRCFFSLFSLIAVLSIFGWQAISVHAAEGPAVIFTKPTVGGAGIGHVGTAMEFKATGFKPGTINLYLTTSFDPKKCDKGDPKTLGLTPFKPNPTATAAADGTFTVDTAWPDNAATPLTAYYICAVNPTTGEKALSSNSFSVAAPVTLSYSPKTIAPGNKVKIAGRYWLPPQPITISILPQGSTTPIATTTQKSDTAGNFLTTITIPQASANGAYTIQAIGTVDKTATKSLDGAITVDPQAPPPPDNGNTGGGNNTGNAGDGNQAGTGQNGTANGNVDNGSATAIILGTIAAFLLIVGGAVMIVLYIRRNHRAEAAEEEKLRNQQTNTTTGTLVSPSQYAGITTMPGNTGTLPNQQPLTSYPGLSNGTGDLNNPQKPKGFN